MNRQRTKGRKRKKPKNNKVFTQTKCKKMGRKRKCAKKKNKLKLKRKKGKKEEKRQRKWPLHKLNIGKCEEIDELSEKEEG